MDIGINLHGYKPKIKIPDERHFELMRANGFTHTFCMSDSPFVCENNITLLSKYNIKFDMLHAPFNGINNMWRQGEKGENMLSRLIEAVDTCCRCGISKLVVHLSSAPHTPFITDLGFSRFDRLLEHALKKNVKIAYENIRAVKNITRIMERQPEAVFCWDTGHESCFSFGKRFMPLFGKRLAALHIHDNRKLPFFDDHRLPFDGKIDFDHAAQEIAKTDYQGPLMLEVLAWKTKLYSILSPEEFYKRAGDATKKISQMVEKYREKAKQKSNVQR